MAELVIWLNCTPPYSFAFLMHDVNKPKALVSPKANECGGMYPFAFTLKQHTAGCARCRNGDGVDGSNLED